jgi:predicted PP-loop superfamily ATPase
MDATAIAGLLNERSEGIEARYDSRSYRCALHIGAMSRRPRTVRFQWQGILREIRAPKLSAFPMPS